MPAHPALDTSCAVLCLGEPPCGACAALWPAAQHTFSHPGEIEFTSLALTSSVTRQVLC